MSVLWTFFGLIFQILIWNWVWLLTMMSYRSSLSFVVIDQYLTELWSKFEFSRHFLDYFFGYWNETWYDCLQWWATDQVWVSWLLINIWPTYGPLDLEFSWNFCFPDIFWINFSDIEMKLGMIAYNDELQVKFEFRCYWWIFDRVMDPWT